MTRENVRRRFFPAFVAFAVMVVGVAWADEAVSPSTPRLLAAVILSVVFSAVTLYNARDLFSRRS